MKPSPNRSHVISTASELFLVKGVANTSMDEVVVKSGVSKSNIYYHFKSKEELVVAVLEYRINMLQEQLGQIAGMLNLSVKERIARMFAALADELEGRACVGGCPVLSLLSAQIPEVKIRIHDFLGGMQKMAEGLLEEGQKRGEFKPKLDISATATLLVTVLEGAIMLAESQGNSGVLVNAGHTFLHLLQV
ncbi:MAG: TetR/AcrR family transcriptional regulator [Clostridia bacterium]